LENVSLFLFASEKVCGNQYAGFASSTLAEFPFEYERSYTFLSRQDVVDKTVYSALASGMREPDYIDYLFKGKNYNAYC